MKLPCQTTCALHALESDNEIEAQIAARETELLKPSGDCYPLSADNLSEAFAMFDMSFFELLAGAIKKQQYVFIHSLITSKTNEYWENAAEKRAIYEVNREHNHSKEDRISDNEGRN